MSGAVIVELPQNGAAAAQGLRPGDLVVAVGDSPVTAPNEATQLAAAARKAGHKHVLLRVEREGNTRFIAVPIEAG